MTNSASPTSLLTTIAHRATLALLAIALAAVAMLVRSWHDARATAAHLQSTLAAQQRTIAAATAREFARDAQTAKTVAQIAAAKQHVKTPAQAAAALPSALPPLPLPIDIELPALSRAAGANAGIQSDASASAPSRAAKRTGDTVVRYGEARIKLQDGVNAGTLNSTAKTAPGLAAPSDATERTASASTPSAAEADAMLHIPGADLKPLYDQLEDCRACQASLSAAQSDLADERTKLAATAAERDAALQSAKGGAFWPRLKRNAKWFALGAAVGAIATIIKKGGTARKQPEGVAKKLQLQNTLDIRGVPYVILCFISQR
jgi:hypothetical protein